MPFDGREYRDGIPVRRGEILPSAPLTSVAAKLLRNAYFAARNEGRLLCSKAWVADDFIPYDPSLQSPRSPFSVGGFMSKTVLEADAYLPGHANELGGVVLLRTSTLDPLTFALTLEAGPFGTPDDQRLMEDVPVQLGEDTERDSDGLASVELYGSLPLASTAPPGTFELRARVQLVGDGWAWPAYAALWWESRG